MPDEIVLKFTVKDDGTPVIERMNKKIGETKKESDALVPGLENAKNAVGGFMSANAALIGVLAGIAAGLVAAYKEYGAYAEQVRDVALVSGESAEETSKFLQVLDDFQLTAEDATAAARVLKEKGLSPNIETLAMLSDQFKQINDPAERLAFIQENLGRGGAKWANALDQGGDALKSMSEGLSESLILSDKQVAEYEQQRLAIDALGDSWTAFKMYVGSAVGSVVLNVDRQNKAQEMAVASLKEQGVEINGATHYTQEYWNELEKAKVALDAETEAQATNNEVMQQSQAELDATIQKQKELSDFLQGRIGLINSIQKSDEAYTKKFNSLTEQRSEAEAKLAKLRSQGYSEQSSQIQGALGDLENIKEQEAALAEERNKQTLQFVSNILAENLARDGWTKEEFDAFAKQQVAWGLWSDESMANAQAVWQEADKVTESINNIPLNKTVNITIAQAQANVTASGSANYVQQLGRDAGGPGYAGQAYNIGASAQPEAVIMNQGGTFVPNADKQMIDYDRLARTLVNALQTVGR